MRIIFPLEIKGFELRPFYHWFCINYKRSLANHIPMLKIPLIIFIALLIWLSPIEGARTYIVDDSGFANYNTIQQAVVAASDGDTIFIKPGEYSEEVILNRSLTIAPLTGETDPIVLDGKNSLENGITITSDGCSLQGLTIENYAGSGIYVQSSSNTITKNIFENDNPAMLIKSASGNTISRNTIANSQGAIALWENSINNLVQENQISGCNVSVLVRNTTGNQITGNKISNAYWGIWLNEAGNCQATSNDIQTRYFGIMVQNSTQSSVAQNRVSFGTPVSGDELNGMIITNCSGIVMTGNEINGGKLGLGISRSDNCTSRDNSIIDSNYAIFIRDSSADDLTGNRINGADYGIALKSLNRSIIRQNEIENSTVAMQLDDCQGDSVSENHLAGTTDTAIQASNSAQNIFSGNSISDSSRGFILAQSTANQLQNNSFQNVQWSLYVDAENREGFDNTIDESNVVDSVPIVYLFGKNGELISNRDIAHLTIAHCDNITVKNVRITNDALFLFDCNNSRIIDNNISSCFGMRLTQSNGNEISGNLLLDNMYSGMFLYASNSNQMAANTAAHNNQNGIALLSCSKNSIHDNTIDANVITGIWLNLSNDNQIYANNISNSSIGLQAALSSGNKIYHNNFKGNQEHSQDLEGDNSWDEGNVTGGNYWTGHVAKGNPSQSWPRMIKGGNMLDHYPFQDESGWLKAAASSTKTA